MTKPCRHSIRLKQYDYSSDGMYFLTICTYKQQCMFGNISQDGHNVNDIGLMIIDEFHELPRRFPIVNCGDYVLMPSHFHCIVEINSDNLLLHRRGAPCGYPSLKGQTQQSITPDLIEKLNPTIGDIVGAFKSITTVNYFRGIKSHKWVGNALKLWQRNYYEHIIRDEFSYQQIADYIATNPAKWQDDEYFKP